MFVDFAVGAAFGAHVVEVVGGLHLGPLVQKLGVVVGFDRFFQGEDFGFGLLLHGVGSPGRNVLCGVGPAGDFVAVVFPGGFEFFEGRRRGGHGDFLSLQFGRKVLPEFEDAGGAFDVFADRFVVEEDAGEVTAGGFDPLGVGLGGERVAFPVGIGEAEGDIIREDIVPQNGLHRFDIRRLVKVVGRTSIEDMFDTFGELGFEAEFFDEGGELIEIDELGVSKDGGRFVEKPFEGFHLFFDLAGEFLSGGAVAKRVVIGLAEEFDIPGGDKILKGGENIRAVVFELFQDHSA